LKFVDKEELLKFPELEKARPHGQEKKGKKVLVRGCVHRYYAERSRRTGQKDILPSLQANTPRHV